MTVERPVKPVNPETIPRPKDVPLLSEQASISAIPVGEKILDGKKPNPKDVSVMIDDVVRDLKEQGLNISSEDIRQIKARAQEGLLPSSSSSPAEKQDFSKTKIPEITEVDLKEYKGVIDGMMRTYGLDKGRWNTVSGVLTATTLVGDVVSGLQSRSFTNEKKREQLLGNFRAVSEILQLKKRTPRQFIDSLPKLGSQQRKDIRNLLLEVTWPFLLSPVYWAVERQAGKIAGKMFMAERTKLQERVNNRIADSLFMRNFEFLHDKSAAEMLQVINNGKDATLDIMSAVHEELIPLRWAQIGSVGKLAFVSQLDALWGLGKKLYMDTRIKPNAQEIQTQRVEELKRWDTVNNKLLATLQGLETVRTSGNAEEGSDVLFASLAERDFVEAGGMQQKRRQDKTMNRAFDVLDIGLPAVTEGFELFRNLKGWEKDPAKQIKTAEEMFSHMATTYFRVTGSRAQQQELRQSFMQLAHLYVNKIIPDIQDIKRMDELLGPYDKLDHPFGLQERARIPVTGLKSFDIKVENLKFKNILRGINLEIPQGSFVTIKGPSGIGKSTLFRHLVGLYSGEPGAVRYGGVDINGIKKYGDAALITKLAYANQSPQYFEDMTLRENLLLWTKQQIPNERIETVLRDLRLEKLIDRLDAKSKHFSGGELRRLGIARALLKDPKVLFLDEPTANLDAASTLQVMNIIQELRKKRPDMTVVAITHDPVFEKIAEKIVDFEAINPKTAEPELGDGQVFEAKAAV